MPDKHSLVDRLYYENRREYSVKEGNVYYLDGAPLRRPLSLPLGQRTFVIIIAIVALVIGFLFINNTVLSSMRETAAQEQAIVDNLARQTSIETIPVMADLVKLDDDEIMETFSSQGYTIYDASNQSDSDEMILYKLASDISPDEAAGVLSKGLNALTAAQATKFLNGSWYFSSDRTGSTSMIVRYADFSTADPQIAVQRAVEAEGIDPTTITESGEDESGNTYSMGVLEIGKKAYTWKVSALPLPDMYSISKLPEEACYVGVRFTAQ